MLAALLLYATLRCVLAKLMGVSSYTSLMCPFACCWKAFYSLAPSCCACIPSQRRHCYQL